MVRKTAIKAERIVSFFGAFIRSLIFTFYVYAFWVGTEFIRKRFHNYDGKPFSTGTMLTVQVTLITGMLMLM